MHRNERKFRPSTIEITIHVHDRCCASQALLVLVTCVYQARTSTGHMLLRAHLFESAAAIHVCRGVLVPALCAAPSVASQELLTQLAEQRCREQLRTVWQWCLGRDPCSA
jgi:hypothetical protein